MPYFILSFFCPPMADLDVIDDRDPLVVYSTGWLHGGFPGDRNSTTTYTASSGSTAMLTFHGVSVAVYGAIGPISSNKTAPLSSYNIDGYDIYTFQPGVSPESRSRVLFFQSPILPNGRHTLVVTSLCNETLVLDYFNLATASSSTQMATSQSSMVASTSITSFTIPSSPTATSLGNSLPNHRILTATVAASISAVAGTIFVIAIVYFFLRRRRGLKPNANIISTFWGDKRPLPALPTNQVPSSSNSRFLNIFRSTREDPPRYGPTSHAIPI